MSRRSKQGFSLIEMLIATTLLFMAVGAIVLVSNANTQAYQTGATVAELESRITIAMNRIVTELRMVSGSVSPDPGGAGGSGGSSVTYVKAESYTAGQANLTTLRQLAFEYEPGELDDGIDNNGNGLIDEGRVVLTEDLGGPAERQLVLVRWVPELLEGEQNNLADDNGNGLVDEAGFVLERSGDDTLIIRLTLQRIDAQGFPITRTAQTSTKVRN